MGVTDSLVLYQGKETLKSKLIMSKGIFKVPVALNEPVLSYAPGTIERQRLKDKLAEMRSEEVELPMVIGGKEVYT